MMTSSRHDGIEAANHSQPYNECYVHTEHVMCVQEDAKQAVLNVLLHCNVHTGLLLPNTSTWT